MTSVDVGGDLLGQVVIGEHNVVVRAEQSVVNVLPPAQRPQPVRRTQISLLPHQGAVPIGRDAEVSALLTVDSRLVQVYGPPGSGKTTLIRHLAGRFTESAVFLPAAGRDCGDVLQDVFQACYDCPGYRPDPVTLRQLMAGIPVRLLLDDLDLPGYDELLDGVPDAAVVCTSASRSVWHEGQAFELAGLGYEASVELLAAVLGRSLADAELATAAELWRVTSGSPLLLLRAGVNARPGADGVVTLPHAAELAELLPRVLGELSTPARGVVSTLTLAGPVSVGLLSALASDSSACSAGLAELTSLGVVLESPWGCSLAPGIQEGLPFAAFPDLAQVVRLVGRLAEWVRVASPGEVAAHTSLVIALIDAAVRFGRPDVGARLAKALAPVMACALATGAWEQVLAHGLVAAELAGDKAILAYLSHEEGVRALVTGSFIAAAAAIGVAVALWSELGMTGHVAVAAQAQALIGGAHAAVGAATGHAVGGAVSGHASGALHATVMTAKGAGVGAKAGLGLGAKLAIAGVATVVVGGGGFVAVHALTAAKPLPAVVSVAAPSGGQLANALLPVSAFPRGNAVIGNVAYAGDGRGSIGDKNVGASACDDLLPPVGFASQPLPYQVGETGFAGDWVGGNTTGMPGFDGEFLQEVIQFNSAVMAGTFFDQFQTRLTNCVTHSGWPNSITQSASGDPAFSGVFGLTVPNVAGDGEFFATVEPYVVRSGSDIVVVGAEEGKNRIDFSSYGDLLPSLASQLVTSVRRTNAHPGAAFTPTSPPSSIPVSTTSPATTTSASGPANVLQSYVAAINSHDYQTAWAIGGQSTQQSYSAFVAGFANTDHDVLTIDSVQGDTVVADIAAYQTDGTKHIYHGTYTIVNNTITHATMQQTG